jgi:Putative transposase/Transposase zinc-binding domain
VYGAPFLLFHSPLEKTPHKATNGELPITCRNRHCPRCQGNARSRWLAERKADLLSVSYFHIVFTLPHELSALALQNKRLLYDLLFRASAATMLELAGDPKHLGADIGFLGVLHTWGQNLQHHPHIHYVVPAGGLAPDGSRWIPSSRRFFLSVAALSRVFRGKFTAGLKELFRQHKLQFHGSLQSLAEPHVAFETFCDSSSTKTGSLPCFAWRRRLHNSF